MEQQRIIRAIIVILIIILTGVGVSRFFFHHELHLQAAKLLPEKKDIVAVELMYGVEKAQTRQVSGNWWLMVLGSTACFDKCDPALEAALGVQEIFNTKSGSAAPMVAFISLDPERDKPAPLRAMAAKLNFFGATGENAELAKLAGFLGQKYTRSYMQGGKEVVVPAGESMPAKPPRVYQLNTQTRIYIFDDRMRYVGYFEPPYAADVLYQDMVQLMDQ